MAKFSCLWLKVSLKLANSTSKSRLYSRSSCCCDRRYNVHWTSVEGTGQSWGRGQYTTVFGRDLDTNLLILTVQLGSTEKGVK